MGKLFSAFAILILGIVTLIYVADPYQLYKELSFKAFYENIEKAIEKLDCVSMYEYKSNAYQDSNRFDYFVLKCEENKKSFIEKVEVHSLWVVGDNGYVDRTRISCLTGACTGEGKLEKREVKRYLFINGKWVIPDDEDPLSIDN